MAKGMGRRRALLLPAAAAALLLLGLAANVADAQFSKAADTSSSRTVYVNSPGAAAPNAEQNLAAAPKLQWGSDGFVAGAGAGSGSSSSSDAQATPRSMATNNNKDPLTFRKAEADALAAEAAAANGGAAPTPAPAAPAATPAPAAVVVKNNRVEDDSNIDAFAAAGEMSAGTEDAGSEVQDAFTRAAEGKAMYDEKLVKQQLAEATANATEEDPCHLVPGCTACTLPPGGMPPAGGSRKLLQFGGAVGRVNAEDFGAASMRQKGSLALSLLQHSIYDDAVRPMCTACDKPGYVPHQKGACACLAGHGDTTPTGVCERCPAGFFSRGGFRAVCVECEGVAWSNTNRTMCECASGWYGMTASNGQATCNQCPGTRPVSYDGARSPLDCRACPAGKRPNEIFSDCESFVPSPPPPPRTLADLLTAPPSPPPAPPAPRLFNATLFANASKDWQITTRATTNWSNPITDVVGSIVNSVLTGKNVSKNAATPGELLYDVLAKPAPTLPKAQDLQQLQQLASGLGGLQNLGQIGAGAGAAAAALPSLLTKLSSQNGTKVSDVLGTLAKAAQGGMEKVQHSDAPSSAGGIADFVAGVNAATGNKLGDLGGLLPAAAGGGSAHPLGAAGGSGSGSGNGLADLLGAVGKMAQGSGSGSGSAAAAPASSGNGLADLLGAFGKMSQGSGSAAAAPASSGSSGLAGLLGTVGKMAQAQQELQAPPPSMALGDLLNSFADAAKNAQVSTSAGSAAGSLAQAAKAAVAAAPAHGPGYVSVPTAPPKSSTSLAALMAKASGRK